MQLPKTAKNRNLETVRIRVLPPVLLAPLRRPSPAPLRRPATHQPDHLETTFASSRPASPSHRRMEPSRRRASGRFVEASGPSCRRRQPAAATAPGTSPFLFHRAPGRSTRGDVGHLGQANPAGGLGRGDIDTSRLGSPP
ncbi:hypothetical protein A8E62_06250 [Burkholderia cenocepacia]|nr:hypothetical protein A8E62_06250 [Burkholderia cenocepacia]ONU94715.1 hypothetical protein A8E63_04970 [Burkholderia cenocepacia]